MKRKNSEQVHAISPHLPPNPEQSNNPLDRLLQDVLSIVQTHEARKPAADKILKTFKKFQPAVMSTTANLWFKKYELESEERRKMQKQLERALETNRILSQKIFANQRLSLSDNPNPTQLQMIAQDSDPLSSDEAIMSPTKKTADLFEGRQFVPFPSTSDSKQDRLSIDGNSPGREELKSCSICFKSLHPVYDELEEKNNRIKILNDVILRMNSKGQSLMSQSNMSLAENSRLERINKELQDTVKLMEQHMTKIIHDNQTDRAKLQNTIEEKRREIEQLHLRMVHLEEEAKQLKEELTRSKKSQSHTRGRDGSFITVRESSSIIMKKDFKENQSLQTEPKQVARDGETARPQTRIILPLPLCEEELIFDREADLIEQTSERTALKRLPSDKPQLRPHPTQSYDRADQKHRATGSLSDRGFGSKTDSSGKFLKQLTQTSAGRTVLEPGRPARPDEGKNKKLHNEKNYICTLI